MSIEAISKSERDELFRHHVVSHIPALLAAARQSTRQLADAEDLVQDTLVHAYRAIHRFDGSLPRARLMTILRKHRSQRPPPVAAPNCSAIRTPTSRTSVRPTRTTPRRALPSTPTSMMWCVPHSTV
jgi:RNA polymerase sigma-70 factor (ECF subfamily)